MIVYPNDLMWLFPTYMLQSPEEREFLKEILKSIFTQNIA